VVVVARRPVAGDRRRVGLVYDDEHQDRGEAVAVGTVEADLVGPVAAGHPEGLADAVVGRNRRAERRTDVGKPRRGTGDPPLLAVVRDMDLAAADTVAELKDAKEELDKRLSDIEDQEDGRKTLADVGVDDTDEEFDPVYDDEPATPSGW